MENYQAIINSPIGKLGIQTNTTALTHIQFLDKTTALLKPQNSTAKKVIEELNAYFDFAQHRFTLDLSLDLSPFQASVLKAMQKIPVGSTRTYGQVAQELKSAPRAIGMACRHNPIPLIIPCHRIVAATHLGGYSGATQGSLLKIKEWLLQHES
ncbi:MAG TPA: methylated-DNA--[protein]-cysteine S-methyltransferase [Coxiellaceae bacterium]|nr:methylated-DNA--[protein]-cysteine S-methyltransferase [Coxiellaceae bacterium]